jgi:IS5 family transposase
VPDATTLLKFRRLLETHDLCKGLFTAINADLAERGLLLREGTQVDATLIAAASSTKNQKHGRDPEMHQTKKGNQWYFGMKAHIGADRDSKLVHTVVVTAANVADITKTSELLHGEEQQVHADAGYTGVEKRPEIAALKRGIDWPIACKRSLIKTLAERRAEGVAQGAGEGEGIGAGLRRTPLPHREKPLRVSENTLSGTGEERPSAPHALRPGQRGDRSAVACRDRPDGVKPGGCPEKRIEHR